LKIDKRKDLKTSAKCKIFTNPTSEKILVFQDFSKKDRQGKGKKENPNINGTNWLYVRSNGYSKELKGVNWKCNQMSEINCAVFFVSL